MAELNPSGIFGIKTFVPYNRITGLPFGRYRVLGGSELNLSSEFIDLTGGAQKYPWDSESGAIDSELTLTLREYPKSAFEVHLGGDVTTNAAEATAYVSAIANKNGTSVVDAVTGIASIAVKGGSETDVKSGMYIAKAVGADTVDVYLMSSEFDSYEDALLKINAAPITIPGTGGTVDITSHGLTLTGGSGAVAFVTDDTANFDTRKINTGSEEIIIGKGAATYPEFGVFMSAQDKANGDQFYINAFRVKGVGLPIAFTEKEWSEAEITMKALYDSTQDKVFDITRIYG